MELKVGTQIGILGGGQLARMLCLAGSKMGLETHVLSLSPTDPAAQVTRHWHQGDLSNLDDLKNFSSNVDFLTFESEFVDTKLLQNAVHRLKTQIFPNISVIEKIQDRLHQKELLVQHGLPTSPFVEVNNFKDAFKTLNYKKLVFKKRLFGYDGYGTFVLSENSKVPLKLSQGSFIAEKFIPFQRELAITLARSSVGEITAFPLVETHQKNSRCLWVKGKTTSAHFPKILPRLSTFLKKINYVGVITFELFETKNEILINELAPRVHNSCHHSLESCNLNQFEAHLKAGLGLVLGKVRPHSHFAMMNLLGSGLKNSRLTFSQDVSLHWYGKLENKYQRKMGHITTLDKNSDTALARLKKSLKGMTI